MNKQKKNLLILGGGIAGVLIIALGAFALNPQGGLYKGAITTDGYDTELTSDELQDPYLVRTEEESLPAPLPDPPEEDPEPTLIDAEPIGEDEYNTTITEEFELAQLEIVGSPMIFDPEISEPKEWPTSIPMISGYSSGGTYIDPNYGSHEPVVLFKVNAHGSEYKQSDNIHLHEFHVDYIGCLGDPNTGNPLTTPDLMLGDGNTFGGYKIATDHNKDGKFTKNEFSVYSDTGLPISFEHGQSLSIEMEVNAAMCSGESARVVVEDILWSDINGEYYLYDPDMSNGLVEDVNTYKLIYYLK